MFQVAVHNLKFTTPLLSNKKLFIGITLKNNELLKTCFSNYDCRLNIATFCEMLEFAFNSTEKIAPLYKLEIYEEESGNDKHKILLGNRYFDFQQDVFGLKDENVYNVKTKLNNDIIIKLDHNFDEIFQQIVDWSSHLPKISTETNLSKMEERTDLPELDLINSNSILKKFIWNLTPIVEFQIWLTDLICWRDNYKTIFTLLCITICIFFTHYVLILSFIILLFTSVQNIVLQFLSQFRVKNEAENLMHGFDRFKRNFTFIQQQQIQLNAATDLIMGFINSKDRTLIVTTFLHIKKVFIGVLFILIFVPIHLIILSAVWGIFLINNPFIQGYIKKNSKDIESNINITIKILKGTDIFLKFQQFLAKFHQKQIYMPSVEQENSDTKLEKFNKKIFFTYENQRWWLGRGFVAELFSGERFLFSDIDGNVSLGLQDIKLPSGDSWKWCSNWEVNVTNRTDEEGWQFATDFKSQFYSTKKFQHLVRRRRWIRKCIKKSGTSPNNNAITKSNFSKEKNPAVRKETVSLHQQKSLIDKKND